MSAPLRKIGEGHPCSSPEFHDGLCSAIGAHAHGAGACRAFAYALRGQQTRTIKALSPKEIAALLKGEGMGMAKAAELSERERKWPTRSTPRPG